MKSEHEPVAKTLLRLAHHYDNASQLFKAVRKRHPDARKKDIVLAALSTMIEQAESNAYAARNLHKMAIEARGDDDI